MEQADMEASSRIELESGVVLTRCDQCRTMHGERIPPTEPPCDTCKVELKAENEEAVQIFRLVRSQVRTRFNGESDVVIDLDINAVKAAMDMYGVADQRRVFEKVRHLFFYFLNKSRE